MPLAGEVYTFEMRPLGEPGAATEPLGVVTSRMGPSAAAGRRLKPYRPLAMVRLWNTARRARHAIAAEELGAAILVFSRYFEERLPSDEVIALSCFLASKLIMLADSRAATANANIVGAYEGGRDIGSFALSIRALDNRGSNEPSSRRTTSSAAAALMQAGDYDQVALHMTKKRGGAWSDLPEV